MHRNTAEPPPSAGFRIRPWIAATVSVLLGIGLFCAAFACCNYSAQSDAAMYLGQMMAVKKGYVSQNIEAWRAELAHKPGPPHVRLYTEGGYAFALYAVERLLGPRAPFHVNSVALPLAMLALAAAVWAAAGNARRGWLASLFLLFFCWVPYIARRECEALAGVARDAPSHLLAFAATAVTLAAVRLSRRRELLAVAGAGAALGLAAWFRLTAGMLAAPLGLFLLLVPRPRSVGQRLRSGAAMGLGMALGLLPLLGQFLLQGNPLRSESQISELLGIWKDPDLPVAPGIGVKPKEKPADVPAPVAAPRKPETSDADDRETRERPEGFHATYFPQWFPRVLNRGVGVFGPWNRYAVLAAAALALVLSRRHAAFFLLTAFMFWAFYSFYDKILWRYLFMGSMLLAAAAALGAALAADRALARLRPTRRALASGALVAALAAPLAPAFWDEADGLLDLGDRWRRIEESRRELESEFNTTDHFIVYDRGFARWMDLFSVGHGGGHKWGKKDREKRKSAKAAVDRVLAAGEHRAFFLNHLDDEGREQASWWKDDLQNEYDLTSMGVRFRGEFMCYRIEARTRTRREVPLDAFRAGDTNLFLFVRKLSAQQRWQDVRICAGSEVAARIQTGPNLVPLPAGVDTSRPVVFLCATSPVPSVVSAATVGRVPGRMRWCAYETMQTVPLAASRGVELRVFGYPSWERDWGGYDRKHLSFPMWRLTPGSSIRIPPLAGDLRVRLYFSAYAAPTASQESERSLPEDLRGIRYRVGDCTLLPRLSLMRSTARRRAAKAEDFIHEFVIPASALAASPDLHMEYTPLRDWDILLFQAEFMPDSADYGGAPSPETRATVWRSGEERGTWGPGGWLDPAFRVLDSESVVSADAPSGSACGVALFVYWPPSHGAGQGTLRVTAPGVTNEIALRPAESPSVHVVPGPFADGTPLRIVPEFSPAPSVCPTLACALSLPGTSGADGYRVTMDSGNWHTQLADGFWNAEQQPDGSWARWTKAHSSIGFPFVGPARNLRVTLTVEGAPSRVGEVPLRITVNGYEVGTARVRPAAVASLVFRIPAERLVEGINTLGIEAAVWQPSDRLRSADTRPLGVMVRQAEWSADSP